MASREARAAVAAFLRSALEQHLAQGTAVPPRFRLLHDLGANQASADFPEVRQVFLEDALDRCDVEPFRPPRFDLMAAFFSQEVLLAHAANGLEELVLNVVRHGQEVLVRREVHNLPRELLEFLLNHDRIQFVVEGRAARRATRSVREPRGPALRANRAIQEENRVAPRAYGLVRLVPADEASAGHDITASRRNLSATS